MMKKTERQIRPEQAVKSMLAAVMCFVMMAVNTGIVTYAAEPFAGYVHNPMENPKAAQDIIVDAEAVYGYSPSPDSTRLKEYARPNYDWSDPAVVAAARKARIDYHNEMKALYGLIEEMLQEAKGVEEIARAVSKKRNEIRLASYKDDPEGLAKVKKSNLDTYGNEEGPTPEFLYEKYGSWQTVIEKALSSNPGMDACLGLYDEYYDTYDLAEESAKTICLKGAKVVLSKTSYVYNGKVRKPAIKTIGGKKLVSGTHYTAAWSVKSPKNVGTYKITITGKGKYTGVTTVTYRITKAANPLKLKGKTAKIKYAKLKRKAQKVKRTQAVTISAGKGDLTYTKLSGAKKIKIAKKNGMITVARKLKKGKYKVKIRVTAAGNKNYKKAVRTTFFYIRVK